MKEIKLTKGVSIPHRYDPNVMGDPIIQRLHGFQFLIGTIQTKVTPNDRPGANLVSIPHRYDPNTVPSHYTTSGRHVSIPHRYDPNRIMSRRNGSCLSSSFNSS